MSIKCFLQTSLVVLLGTNTFAGVITKDLKYTASGKTMIGYLAMPETIKEPRPAILVVHEWWGQTDYPRNRAKQLAELGYIALAVDMFGDKKTSEHPDDAGKFAHEVMKEAASVRVPFDAALTELKKVPGVDAKKIAAIGFCFGGSVALEMAKQGADLRAIVLFHSGLRTPTPIKAGTIKAKTLVLNGAADTMVKTEDIEIFKKEMTSAGAYFEFVNLEGAMHGFSNPDASALGQKHKMHIAYNEEATKKAWEKMQSFLAEAFKG